MRAKQYLGERLRYEAVDLMYFFQISLLYEKFYPGNIRPVVKFFVCLDLERKSY